MVDDCTSLFEHATRGDRNALDQLLVRYLPQLHAYVHARLGPELRGRESSLDVVQSLCRQLLTAKQQFEGNGEDRFRAWLFTTALNKMGDRHRRAHRGGGDDEVDAEAFEAPAKNKISRCMRTTLK